MKSASKIISRIGVGLLLSVGLFNLAGCGEDFNLSLSQYKIENLKHKGTYVGLPNEEVSSSKPKLPAEIKITYSSNSGRLPVFLNGQTVSQHLTYSNTEASLETAKIADLLRQGVNTLSVAPLSFGPQATFSFDNAGPFIDVNQLKDVSGGYELELRVADTTSIAELYVQAVDYQWDGGVDDSQYKEFKTSTQTPVGEKTFFTQQGKSTIWRANSAIDADASMYLIYAKDAYGYETTNYYLAPDQKINNIFKMALDKDVLDNVVPLAKHSMEDMHIYSPLSYEHYGKAVPEQDENAVGAMQAAAALDSMNRWWTSRAVFYDDVGTLTGNKSDCGFIDQPIKLTNNNFQCKNIKQGKLNGRLYCQPDIGKFNIVNLPSENIAKEGHCSRIVVHRARLHGVEDIAFTLSDDKPGNLSLDLKLTQKGGDWALETDMGIRNVQCKQRFKTERFCTRRDGTDIFGYWCLYNAPGSGEDGIEVDANGFPLQNLSMDPFNKNGDGNAFCKDDGSVSYLSVDLGDMEVKSAGANPKGPVGVLIHDGELDLDINSKNVKLNFEGDLHVGGSVSGFMSWVINLVKGLLEDMFVDITAGVIKSNMKDFTLGFDFFTPWDDYNDPDAEAGDADNAVLNDPSLRMQAQGYQVWTNADNNPATPLKWYMYYAGFLQSLKEHPELDNKVLGSLYAVEPVLHPVTSDSKLDVAVNINMVNQALMSLYRSGMSHITVTNRKFDDVKGNATNVHFGPGITNAFAMKNNDIRVQLIPRGPGELEMKQGGNGAQGTLYYRNAKMLVETYSKGGWSRNFTMEVDMRIGVLMTAEDQKFQIKILGMPELDINKIALGKSDDYIYNNESESVNIFLNNNAVRGVVQFAVDLVLNLAVPQMAMKIGEIDYPGIAVPKSDENGDYIVDKGIWMTTESIEANNGAHLSFGLGMDLDKECAVKEGIQLDKTGKPELTFCDSD